jgi:pre-mRNA-processing factor 6
VNLESDPADARVILARAVEVIPTSVELWLALARLGTPQQARQALNTARKTIPTSHEIWVAAGRLVEQQAHAEHGGDSARRDKELASIDALIEGAVRSLRAHQVLLTREQWLREAERCEAEGSPRTCEAIVKASAGMELEDEDRLDTWAADADGARERGRLGTARALLAHALRVFPDRRDLWWKAAQLERAHGDRAALEAVLERAVHHVPQAETLWLMWAKERWLAGDVLGARGVLERAFVANPESEEIWLAAVKLEAENGEVIAARELLVRARAVADTDRVSVSVCLERTQC